MAEEDPWAAYLPISAAPKAEPTAPSSKLGRERFFEELSDPNVLNRLIGYTRAEVGGQGEDAVQAFIESTFNRSVARNQPLAKTLSGSYFPSITHIRAQRPVRESDVDAYSHIIDRVLSGSNLTNYATGNASGTVGFAGGPQTFRAGGERFGIEGPDRGWWSRVGASGPGFGGGEVSERAINAVLTAPTGKPEPDPWARYFKPVAESAEIPTAAQPTQGVVEGDPWARYFKSATEVEEAPAAPGVAEPQAQPPPAKAQPYAITRGFVSGLVKENPAGFADFLEGQSYNAPESFKPSLQSAAEKVRGLTKDLTPEGYERQIASMWDIKGVGDALTWAGEAVGGGIASSLPSLALGGVGAVGGALTPIPGGAVGGGLLGAGSASYAQNYGEVYGALKAEGVSPEQASHYANIFAPPIAALDVASLGTIAGRFTGAAQAARQEVVKGIAKRIAGEAARGGATEFSTEAAQELVKDAAITAAAGKPFFTPQTALGAIEAGVAGGLTGGTMAAPAGIRTAAPRTAVPTVEESAAAIARSQVEAPGPPPMATPEGEKLPQPVDPEETLKEIPATPGIRVAPQQGIVETRPDPPAPVFYSQLLRTAEEKLPESATVQQVLATLRNAPGVKAEEIADTGLETFLKSQEGRVSKKDVVEYLEQNQIQVETVVDSSVGVSDPGWTMVEGGTQFDFAKAPGPVTNYMELRLRVPPRNEDEHNFLYNGPHWSENNVVAHVRATSRVDKAGNPVLHIEEVQSDWHQQAREVGMMTREEQAQWGDLNQQIANLEEDRRKVETELYTVKQTRGNIANTARMNPELMARMDPEMGRLLSRAVELTDQTVQLSNQIRTLQRQRHNLRLSPKVEEEGYEGYGRLKKVPAAPFRSNWVDLSLKRMLRWAADHGYEKVSWQSPELAAAWNTGAAGDLAAVSPRTRAGLNEFYGKIIPSRMKKIASKFGGVLGETRFSGLGDTSISVFHVTVPQAARTAIQRGLTLYNRPGLETSKETRVVITPAVRQAMGPEFAAAARRMAKVFDAFAKRVGFDNRVTLQIQTGTLDPRYPDANGLATNYGNGTYLVQIDASAFGGNIAAFYSTMMHEFGHVVLWDKFEKLPDAERNVIRADYDKWREEAVKDATIGNMLATRIAGVDSWIHRNVQYPSFDWSRHIRTLSKDNRDYHLSFDEWFADQVARWATSTEAPITLTEKIYSGIGKALRYFLEYAAKALGVDARPTLLMQNWLNSVAFGLGPMGATEYAAQDVRTQKENQYYVSKVSGDANVSMPPQQPATAPIRNVMDQLFSGNPPAEVKEMAAHADRMNWFYKYVAGLLEVRDANPNLPTLHQYVERVKLMDEDMSKIQDAATRIAKDWRGLGSKQSDALVQFLDELANMSYLTADEQKRGVVRQPTPQEVQALMQRVGLESRGADVAAKVKSFFDTMLGLIRQNALMEAMAITDPVARAKAVDQVNAEIANMQKRPYFPFMRFGRHYVTVRDKDNKVIHFETFERKGLQTAERRQQRKAQELRAFHGADATVETGLLPESVEPFIGLPPTLLKHIQNKLNLTPAQLDALEQLQFQLSPSLSFKHHFQHKNFTPGYSKDFQRAFARYAFSISRYYGKTKHVDVLRQLIRDTRKIQDVKTHKVADYMSDHLENNILDSKGDYGIFKGAIFLWAMGFVPASAVQNLSQTPMVTFPYLGSIFGEGRSSAAITRALTQLSNFQKKGTYPERNTPSEWQMRAFGYGIRSGHISETQAAELAGLAQGTNLIFGAGGTGPQRASNWVMEKSAWMFEMAEQFNRRVAFRAALELASANPSLKQVKDSVARNPERYDTLIKVEQFTPAQAQAITFALDAVDRTQFVYKRYARPRFMRGRLSGTVFVFHRYIQALAFMNINDKSFLWRYALMAMLVGGMGGIPGYEDLKDLVEGVMKRLGYDFDVERTIRRWVIDHTNGVIPPDMVLGGLARRGMGIPALLDLMGSFATGRPGRGFASLPGGEGPMPGQNVPWPQFDVSKMLSPGPLLPVTGKLLDPTLSDKQVASEMQKAGGAVFSAGINIYKAIMDNQLEANDPKRWERAVPRIIAGASKTFRTYTEGRERVGPPASGSTVVNYDVRDTEQLMEVIGFSLGFNNLRQTGKWDYIMAQKDHEAWIKFNRDGLLAQFFEAKKGDSVQELDEVKKKIQEFNDGLSDADKGQRITGDTIRKSVGGRERELRARETGIPTQRTKRLGAQELQHLFPEATIDVRRR